MRRFPATAFILVVVIIGSVIGWRLFAHNETARFRAVNAIRTSRTYVKLALNVAYPEGSIARETYTLIDDNGISKATYVVANRNGTVATFDEAIRGYDVSFAFQKTVLDGIWQINSKHARALDEPMYTVSIFQTDQGQSGSRTVSFTNPRYWATAAGREYHIHLDPKKPVPSQAALLRMDSTLQADPRYLKIVDDFKNFGSPIFRRTVASARAKLLRS